MDKFEYDAPADLYWSDRQGPRKRPVMYRGFARSADAICFAIEQLPPSAQPWAIMEMGDDRIEFAQIRALYDGERYPLIRKDLQPRDLATASVTPSATAGLRRRMAARGVEDSNAEFPQCQSQL
jgi:hypothetical protein